MHRKPVVLFEYFPVEHCLHVVCNASGWDPAGHVWQIKSVPNDEISFGLHPTQDVRSAEDMLPGAHGVQVSLPDAELYEPGGQTEHPCADVSFWKEPAGQR